MPDEKEDIVISIIMPVYNAAKYLKRSLDSAVAQTVTPKEIICIDDGSTDGSPAILEEYRRRYPYIKVITQDNQGSGPARNRGLEAARGQFVCFLDADDYYLDETALEKMARCCVDHDVKICGGWRKEYDSETGEMYRREVNYKLIYGESSGKLIYFNLFPAFDYYQNYVFERQLINENNITFPAYRRCQDPPFFLRAMIAAGKYWLIPIEVYCYKIPTADDLGQKMITADYLKGIRDCFILAVKYGYPTLIKDMVNGLEHEGFDFIAASGDPECRRVLAEIVSLLPEQYEGAAICYLHKLWALEEKGITLPGRLREMGMDAVSIYGLGVMGKLLYHTLLHADVRMRYAIHKTKKSFFDLDVVNDLSKAGRDVPVVVTPVGDTGKAIGWDLLESGWRREQIVLLPALIDEMWKEQGR